MLMKNKETNRRRAFRTISIITSIVVLLVVLGMNIVVNILGEDNNWNIDCSKQQYYSISQQTIEVLNGLNEDVYIYTLYNTGSVDETIYQLVSNYAVQSNYVHVENIDLTLNPGFTQKYDPYGAGIKEGSMIVTNADASLYKVLTVFDLYKIDTTLNMVWAIQAEPRITSVINYLKTGISPTIKLLAGHGESTLLELEQLSVTLKGLGYDFDPYDSTTATQPLDPDFNTLMVVSPKTDLANSEYESIKQFLKDGGNALFLIDYVALDTASGMFFTNNDHLDNFNALLMRYDVQINRNYIIGGNPNMILNRPGAHIPVMFKHMVTENLIEDNKTPVLSDVSSLTISGKDPSSAIILLTDKNTWAKDLDGGSMQINQTPEDETGPFVIAAVGEVGNSRIAVFGTSSFVQSGEIERSANQDLIVGTVNSLANTSTDINIAAKLMVSGTINLASELQKNILIALVVGIMPLTVIVFGMVVWLRRRRK